ncbi:MAG: 2-C-methyl-D-erythritol 4-phosphate cytidylyltransferase [Tissierellia bacterium]|nr:2-C-methyl-D-erythritol 4-phosphate cytidylyltransferase [Tissierellia bacterium]
MFISAIITGAGDSVRMNLPYSKMLLEIGDKKVIEHVLDVFCKTKLIDEIILVLKKDEISHFKRHIVRQRYCFSEIKLVEGGNTREESTFKGLMAVDEKSQIVICHDGARPFVTEELIVEGVRVCMQKGNAIPAVPLKDTVKEIDREKNIVINTPKRENIYAIQTPQVFKTKNIIAAYKKGLNKYTVTDDSQMLELAGEDVHIFEGDYNNIKITTREDIAIGMKILEERNASRIRL